MTQSDPNLLGHFRPIAQLGQGGMARVLLVSREGPANIQKLLVLKEIREEFADDAEFVSMFMDEARLATRMNHPNLVQTYDVGAEGHRNFMVMEYLEGQPMHSLLGRLKRKLSLATHLHMLLRVLSGLHYAHELTGFDGTALAVVHRDVSPQNTFVCYDGQVKLVDFGIAKAAGIASRTTAGVFKGKLGYVAPEQVTGHDVDRRADIFSVGVMLWEALVGRRMTYGEGEAAVLHKRTTGTQARVLEARPDADPGLAAICDKAMAFDPAQRFATAAEMQAAIEARMEELRMRASDADVARLVSETFAEERKGLRALVERQLSLPLRRITDTSAVSKLPMVQTDDPASTSLPQSFGTPSSRNSTLLSGSPIVGTGTSMAMSHDFRKPRRTMLFVGSGAAVIMVGIIAAIAALASHGSSSAAATPSAITSGASAPPPSPATPAKPAAAASVDVAIDVAPARASVSMDGKLLGQGPFHGSFTKDGSDHEVVVSADGYTAESRRVTLDRDMRLEFALKPRVVFGRPGPTGVIPPPIPAASGVPTAGSQLQVGPRNKHSIDEKDPYQ